MVIEAFGEVGSNWIADVDVLWNLQEQRTFAFNVRVRIHKVILVVLELLWCQISRLCVDQWGFENEGVVDIIDEARPALSE